MKKEMPRELELGRIMLGPLASSAAMKFNGAFEIESPHGVLGLIVSDGGGWEHVSVQVIPQRGMPQGIPDWDTMCWVKDLVWDKNEWVVQFHPAAEDYVNNHPYVLHLWRPTTGGFPTPPPEFVGLVIKKKDRHGR